MQTFKSTLFVALSLLLFAQLSEAFYYWPFNPYFEQEGRKRSPSQGECRNTTKIAQRRCSDGSWLQPLNAIHCWQNCHCDGGVFKCTHYGDCSSDVVTKWCQCPDGKSDTDNCVGFMELCYCTPPGGLPEPAWKNPGIAQRRDMNVYRPAVEGLAEANAWDRGFDQDAATDNEDKR